MEKLLQEKNCYLRSGCRTGRKLFTLRAEPLIEQNYCTTAYEDAIYEITEERLWSILCALWKSGMIRQQPIRCQWHADGCDRAQGASEIQAGRIWCPCTGSTGCQKTVNPTWKVQAVSTSSPMRRGSGNSGRNMPEGNIRPVCFHVKNMALTIWKGGFTYVKFINILSTPAILVGLWCLCWVLRL